MNSLEVFVLCHNRPEQAKKAIHSVLAQKNKNFKLTISDNSTHDDVKLMVKKNFPTINYIRRKPSMPPFDHSNQCLSEITKDYFCLFHDDDIMLPEYTQVMSQAILQYPNAIALGANARIAHNKKTQKKPSFITNLPYKSIQSPQELLNTYFGRHQTGIAPYPSYIYKKSNLGSLAFSNLGGKHSDVIWLLQLVKKNPIIWVNQPLLIYNLHGDNLGLQESLKDRLKFLGFLKQNPSFTSKRLTSDYRFFIYKKVLTSKKVLMQPQRMKKIKTFMLVYRVGRFFRLQEYLDMLKKYNLQKI